MSHLTADELAMDILERQGVADGPIIGADCTPRQTAYLFDLIAPERIGYVGGRENAPVVNGRIYGVRVGHGVGWELTEGRFGGQLRLDTRARREVA